MNSEKKPLSVAIMGISEHERNIIKSIFQLSLYRTHSYTLILGYESCHILLIDADDPGALAVWRAWNESRQGQSPTSVMVAKNQPANTDHWIRRPLITTRVLSVLDQIAVECSVKRDPSAIVAPGLAMLSPALIAAPIVLVVDDSSTVRKQVELELAQFDLRVDGAESGEQAVELLARHDYDLIFLDVVLPGVDGYQLCKTIKKDKTTKKTPVVMLTSKSSPFDRIRGALSGCDTYLTKPLKQSAFQGVVKKYLKN